MNKDICVKVLETNFEMYTENTTGNPMLSLSFNDDVCITKDIFFNIYEPYCVKKNE